MAFTTINKSTDHFNTKLYTGTGSSNAITGVGFQPDWVWIKNRSSGSLGHQAFDVLRGVTKRIFPNDAAAEETDANALTAFGSDGFTVGSNTGVNASGNNIVAWNWKGGGSGSTNNDGATASTVSANQTAGFSIVKHAGSGSATTIGHGLGASPKIIITKALDVLNSWIFQQNILGGSWTSSNYLILNSTAAAASSSTIINNVNNSTISFAGSNDWVNSSSYNYVHYCFAEKTGYSKFGSYTANGSADGTFVFTGFAPKFIIMKRTDTGGYNWVMYDDKRNTYNPWTNLLLPNLTNAEITSGGAIDFLSNGFKLRSSSGANPTTNQGTIIYMAFGQSLVGSNNVPCTAR